jgi:signal transduction histidine kinase
VTVEVLADELAELPAAVEVAAYRIVAEGLTNVMRPARATRCRVSIRCGRMLELEVEDDGRGIEARPGVGIASMRERAEELGGSFAVTSDHRGTRVSAVLPVAEAG